MVVLLTTRLTLLKLWLSCWKELPARVSVDTMIIQAIGLLDDLDKDLNTYAMRVREWYGWHFPELAKIISDNILYAKSDKLMGNRVNAAKLDFSEELSMAAKLCLR
ncbi:unnamed protein product [Eruca vesicaria subsp. sativa]|uniref:NOSIC domain-containing protein n=1 Tax=Eruca vesicaria subsp. sativa TaxID=29727 RepID=A0ABC8JVV1_ERUVS|nr:unnamed protein product [Eruca vesicaria subsp. sativa]